MAPAGANRRSRSQIQAAVTTSVVPAAVEVLVRPWKTTLRLVLALALFAVMPVAARAEPAYGVSLRPVLVANIPLTPANDGPFINSGQALGGATGNGVALGDLDGDGDIDALVANDYASFGGNVEANQVWLNQGDGTFTPGQTLGNFNGHAVALGDLDGDGDLDAVIAGSEGNLVWVNQGGAQAGQAGTFASGALLGSNGYGVAIGDVDNDGDLDVLIVGNASQVYLNNGNATFTAGPAFPFQFSRSVALADLDGDGWLDAVIADSADGSNTRVWWNDGNWSPGPGSFTLGPALPVANLVNAVAVADLDGDGRPDVFLASSGPDQIYWKETGRDFSTAMSLGVNDNSSAVALGDVDGDGRVDVVVGNVHAQPMRLWRNDGGRSFTVGQEFGNETGQYWSRGLGLADLTGDGALDLFEVTTAEDRVWHNTAAPPEPALAWQLQTVAQRGQTGHGPSLALDSQGRPHVSFVEYIQRQNNEDSYRLSYAMWDGQLWRTSIVDTGWLIAPSTSLALDSQGRPHIVYETNAPDSLDERLAYAYWDGNQWQRQIVHVNAEPDGHFSLAIDTQDRPHISYFHGITAQDLNYARWDGEQWQHEVVDAAGAVGEFNSLALDEVGNPHIAYYDRQARALKYATRSGGGPWQVSVADGAQSSGTYASLSLDSAGRPHIAYISDGDVRYARHNGTTWLFDTIVIPFSTAQSTVLTLDPNDEPHLIWNVFPTADVWYGRRQGSGWHTEVAATSPSFGGHDIVLDGDLTPHIAFYHGAYGDLRYAVLTHPWRVHSLDSPGAVEPPSLALALGRADRAPLFSYYKPASGLLRVAEWEQAVWQLSGVDFISATGADPSLAIGNDGRPRVSYYDADAQQLRYAAWNGSAWQSQVVDPVPGRGQFSTLLLQGVRPDIVYWDVNARQVRLARWSPPEQSWQLTANLAGPTAAGGSGHSSAARLSDGRIVASYFRSLGEAGELRLATWDGQAWTDELVVSGLAPAAPYNSLAIDAVENEPAVAYYRQGQQQIWYAFRQAGNWQSAPAVNAVSNLNALSLQLALDSRRQPRIAYTAGNRLHLAHGNNGAWQTRLVFEQEGLTLNGVSLGLDQRQHIAFGSSSGLRYAVTVASSAGPDPVVLTPYDPVSPFLACFEFLFSSSAPQTASAAPPAGVALAAALPGSLNDLDIFLAMTPLFQATAGGEHYIGLYGDHVVEATDIVLDDMDLLWDSFGTLQNFMPGLAALVTGRGDQVVVTQDMVDDALDIWQRLAAAGSPALAGVINDELAKYDDLQDFVGLSFDDWARAIGVNPPSSLIYLPLVANGAPSTSLQEAVYLPLVAGGP
jgi:hypothetical protein